MNNPENINNNNDADLTAKERQETREQALRGSISSSKKKRVIAITKRRERERNEEFEKNQELERLEKELGEKM